MDLSGRAVAVTGATGFIGRYLACALAERGAQAIGVVRSPERGENLRQRGIALRRADLADRRALAAAFEGVDAVVCNAALVSIGTSRPAEVIAANVAGTRRSFEAMAAAGVRRAVLISSAVAYRPKRDHRYSEDDPLRGDDGPIHRLNVYAVSKARAEREAWVLAERHGIALSSVRPHTVFGAYDRQSFTRWLKLFMGPPVSVFPAGLYFPPVYAGDLAEAVCRILERDETAGRAYNLAARAGEASYWDLMCAYRNAGGPCPRWVLPLPVPLRRSYATERAERELSFAPRPLVDAFRDMLAIERGER
jgi:nucleoside-diphosphate-sugar epimerase